MITEFEQKLIDMCDFMKDSAHLHIHTNKEFALGILQGLDIVKAYMPEEVLEQLAAQEAVE